MSRTDCRATRRTRVWNPCPWILVRKYPERALILFEGKHNQQYENTRKVPSLYHCDAPP